MKNVDDFICEKLKLTNNSKLAVNTNSKLTANTLKTLCKDVLDQMIYMWKNKKEFKTTKERDDWFYDFYNYPDVATEGILFNLVDKDKFTYKELEGIQKSDLDIIKRFCKLVTDDLFDNITISFNKLYRDAL